MISFYSASISFYCRFQYQQSLRDKSTSKPTNAKLKVAKHNLKNKIKDHHSQLLQLAPGLNHFNLTPTNPETDTIYLPSSFTPTQIHTFGLEAMSSAECHLREGHCHDTLDSLRKALGSKSFLSRSMKSRNRDQNFKNTTRGLAAVQRATQHSQLWASVYRHSYNALIHLRKDPAPLFGLQVLAQSDMTMLSTWLEDELYKDKNENMSWLWKMAPMNTGLNAGKFMDRIHGWNEEGKAPFPKWSNIPTEIFSF